MDDEELHILVTDREGVVHDLPALEGELQAIGETIDGLLFRRD